MLISHLHPDHSAGLTLDGKAVFGKAVVHVHQSDTRFWLEPRNKGADPDHAHVFDQAARDLAPYQALGRVRSFAADAEIVPGVPSPRRAIRRDTASSGWRAKARCGCCGAT